jgi:acyl dehydratase
MGGLIASGWHTASTTMGLFVTGRPYQPAPGSLGGGFESLKWFQPVRPGDQLRVRVEVTGVRESASKPDRGIVTSRITTLNQRDEAVQEMVSSGIIPKRNP